MSEAAQPAESHRVENPVEAFDRMKQAVKQALTVSKPEILRREAEAMKQRKAKRNDSGNATRRNS